MDYDAAVVGYGPVGQAIAGLLGQKGWRVGVFERWPGLYPLPRACVVDHEIMRVLQALGVAEAFAELAVPTAGEYVWLGAQGQTLYHFKYERDGASGWPARNLMYQPELEATLDRRVRDLDNVEVHQGWEALDVRQDAEGVRLQVAKCALDEKGAIAPAGEQREITARYLVGADGANSFVRRQTELPWTNLGFLADWLVVDFRLNDPECQIDMPEAGQICDPARPMTVMRRMGHNHARWEMMLLPGETAAEITRPEIVWSMISRWVEPKDGVVERAVVYTFRSGVAASWSRGRIVLAGDAAHLMPPFLGQGLCSGLRDAMSLSWRLDLMLSGHAPSTSLLDYEEERKPHVTAVIERAVALGKVVCITDPDEARRRDHAILAGTAPPVPPFPGLATGVLHRRADGSIDGVAGQLSLQPIVATADKTGRLDDLAGGGWRVISCEADAGAMLSPRHLELVDVLGLKFITVRSEAGPGEFEDVDGKYASHLRKLGVKTLVVRPDFYIFAGASSAGELPSILDDLAQQLFSQI